MPGPRLPTRSTPARKAPRWSTLPVPEGKAPYGERSLRMSSYKTSLTSRWMKKRTTELIGAVSPIKGRERAAVARVDRAADYALSNRRAAAATDLALSGSRSYWCGADPFSGVTRGLDHASRIYPTCKSQVPKSGEPDFGAIHPRRKSVLQRRWIAGSSPAMNRVSSGMASAARPRACFGFHSSSRNAGITRSNCARVSSIRSIETQPSE